MRGRLAVFIVCMTLGGGCAFPQAKLDEAGVIVAEVLEAWKKGGKMADTKSLPRPIDFFDELWAAGEALVAYEVAGKHYHEREKMIRVEARLTVRSPRGVERAVEVTYDVELGTPPKVNNNPMP